MMYLLMLLGEILFMEKTNMSSKARQRNINIFFELTKRHLLVFFKSKITVLYTLLVPIIVLVIYILFLKELEMNSVKTILVDLGISLETYPELGRELYTIIDSWMLSGILAVTSISVSIQTNYIFVRDKDNGINKDFISSPIKGPIIIASYFLFNFIVTFIVNFAFLLVCFLYLYANGEFMLNMLDFIMILGVMVLSVLCATLSTIFLCSFIKKESSLSSIIAIFSTAIGFLIGAYMPMGMMPKFVQNICTFFPGTHSCGLYRYVFLSHSYDNLKTFVLDPSNGILNGADLIAQLEGTFGFNLNFFDYQISPGFMTLVVIGFIIIFLILNLIVGNNLTKTNDNKSIFWIKKRK